MSILDGLRPTQHAPALACQSIRGCRAAWSVAPGHRVVAPTSPTPKKVTGWGWLRGHAAYHLAIGGQLPCREVALDHYWGRWASVGVLGVPPLAVARRAPDVRSFPVGHAAASFYPLVVGVIGAAYSGSTHAPLPRCCGLGRWSSKLPGPRRPADLVGGLSCCLRRNATPCAHKIGRGARAFHVVACATTSPRRGTTFGVAQSVCGPYSP